MKIDDRAGSRSGSEAPEKLMDLYYRCDDSAFAEIYSGFYPAIVCFFRRLGFRDDPEDLAEECFLKIINTKETGRGRFQQEYGFSTWIYRIARHEAIDRWRKQGSGILLVDAASDEDGESGEYTLEHLAKEHRTPHSNLVTREFFRCLQHCLEGLPPLWRAVLLLHAEIGLKKTEVADILETSNATVTRHHRSSLSQIASCLGENGFKFAFLRTERSAAGAASLEGG